MAFTKPPSFLPDARNSGPSLRLFDDAAASQDDGSPFDGELSGNMTLPQFVEEWFIPVLLVGDGKKASTVTLYRELVDWWLRLTTNPPVNRINDRTIADFKTHLGEATYRRGRTGPERKLAPATRSKHLAHLRAILHRLGPTIDRKRPGKNLVADVPYLTVTKSKTRPKRAFAIDEALRIVGATRLMPLPRYRRLWKVAPPDLWFGFIMILFYTGLRTGTVLKLRWDMIADQSSDGQPGVDGGRWLIVPGSIVDKTSKPLDKFFHPAAHAAIERLRGNCQPGDLIIPWPHWRRHINDRHEYLQRLAGLDESTWLSPQAWRRSHGKEMARVGAKRGIEIAQHALDHADERTTRESYVHIEPELILQLPCIDLLLKSLEGERQLELF